VRKATLRGKDGGVSSVVVSGAVANKLHNGGATWTRLSYALGFQKLGFDVYFIEEIDPGTCVDEQGCHTSVESSANLAYFKQVMEQFGLGGRVALLEAGTRHTEGIAYAELLEIADSAGLLFNISGHLRSEELKKRFRKSLYLDLDPGYTQFWYEAGLNGESLHSHDYYFTVGENIGTYKCGIPTGGFSWKHTRQPVVLDQWPAVPLEWDNRFTTVASWRGPFGPVARGGKRYGSKVHQFRKYIDLPLRTGQVFEIALDIDSSDRKDRHELSSHGWQLTDPRCVGSNPCAFREYIQTSAAEFSVAQETYVETKSGWFSDRTVRYLASGRPVLVEDTGFREKYPTSEGLLTFATLTQALEGVEDIQRRYQVHADAARQLAETYFDSNIVLGELATEVEIAP
jgi:hypothetical protein